MALEENFAKEIENCIVALESDDLAVADVDAPVDSETVTHATQEGGEVTYDLPDEVDEPVPEIDSEIGEGVVVEDSGAPEVKGGDGLSVEGTEPEGTAGPVISDAALTRAVQAGMSLEDARSVSSEAHLDNISGRMEFFAEGMKARIPDAVESAPEVPADPLAALPDLDPEEYDAKTIEMFAAVKGVLKQQQETIASFQEAQDTAAASSQAAIDRETTQWFDSEIKGLGEDFGEILGQGNFDSLVPGSSQLAKRNEIASLVGVLFEGHRASGRQMPSREDIFRVAAGSVLADEYKSLHDREVSAGLEKRAGQHIGRVTGKKSSPTKTPEDVDNEIAALIDSKFGA